MTLSQKINYLKSSGYSDEQIKAILGTVDSDHKINVTFDLQDLTIIQLVKLGDVLCTFDSESLELLKQEIARCIPTAYNLTEDRYNELIMHLLRCDVII